ncbi:MAG TPA: molybdenum cofactor guanylyltransferase [Pyrinomonadaceae bacterium]|nr:molybdenum cofactor guanylyltransferase [Pyrinomonadaceae bacterium]
MMTRDSVAGFILIGGAASRMGSDKSQLLIENETFVQRIARELALVTAQVSVVGRPEQFDPGLPVVYDLHPQWGALGGVHGALANCASEWALIVACDLPQVKGALFERLLSLRSGFEAVAPLQPDGRRQPLCALYRVVECLPRAAAMIESGERKPVALLQSVRTRWVQFAELADLPGAEDFFDNINTPQDYLRISRETDRLD